MIKELVVDWSASLDMQRALNQGFAHCVTRRVRGIARQRLVVTQASSSALEANCDGLKIVRMRPEELVEEMDCVKFLSRPFVSTWRLGPLEERPLPGCLSPIAKIYGTARTRLFASTRILLVGAGRSGSSVFSGLLEAGFRHITCVDPDLIEEQNTILSEYAQADIGRAKVEVLHELANSVGAECEAMQQDIREFARQHTSSGLLFSRLADFDLAFSAVDQAHPRAVLAAACSMAGVPLIDIGTSVTPAPGTGRTPLLEGRILVTIPGRECLLCLQDVLDPEACRSELEGTADTYPGDATLSRLLGRQAVLEAVGLIAETAPSNSNQVVFRLGSEEQMAIRSRRPRVSGACRYCHPSPHGVSVPAASGQKASRASQAMASLFLLLVSFTCFAAGGFLLGQALTGSGWRYFLSSGIALAGAVFLVLLVVALARGDE